MHRLLLTLSTIAILATSAQSAETRRISAKDYRDRMMGGWLGQMAGVSWGAPTEFRFKGVMIPADKMPAWKPEMVNDSFAQDDLYCDMTFLRTLEEHGLGVSQRQAGIDFANSGYRLWHANRFGREALRKGIAPPDSGHPKFNKHADDIDFQIEADFAGLVAPGLPNIVIELGDKFGHIMNYGDGVYGGQFVGGMYAEAFFEKDPVKLVEAGLKCIPEGSQYAECIRDTLAWYKEAPDDWEKTWQKLNDKYHLNLDYRKGSCEKGKFNIDAKLNGAYIVIGLLYGKGDLDKTIVLATRPGQDSDCNPASAAGVIFTTIGFEAAPARFKEKMDATKNWVYTSYNFEKLIAASEKVARQAVVKAGGTIEKDAGGAEVFVLPIQEPRPSKLEQVWEPGPIAGAKFTPEEMAKINPPPDPTESKPADAKPKAAKRANISADVSKFAPGWMIKDCGDLMSPGLRDELGRKNVLVTHPLAENIPCILGRRIDVPPGKKTNLHLVVGHHPEGNWVLSVTADRELVRKVIGPKNVPDGWATVDVDLSSYAGQIITVQLINAAHGWSNEAAYWGEIKIESH